MSAPLLFLLASLLIISAQNCAAADITYNCESCIERKDFFIRAIVHGIKSDAFWQRVKAASVQAAKDMRVNLQFDLYDDDAFSFETMADDIRTAATGANPPDALVVSIPADEIAEAVSAAVNSGIPVFGLNSGYRIVRESGVLGFVAMDEYLGGVKAAEGILAASASSDGGMNASSTTSTIATALYINHAEGNFATEERRNGFGDTLSSVQSDFVLTEAIVSFAEEQVLADTIASSLAGCNYEAVLLPTSSLLPYVLDAPCPNLLIATFDANQDVYTAIVTDDVAIGISQQEFLQGSLPIIMATTHLTTGQVLLPPADSEDGVYLSGPKVYTKENIPFDTDQICEAESYPVCPSQLAPDGTEAKCGCSDRSGITIGGVVHGVSSDSFWDTVFAASEQAARDMGVNLDVARFDAEVTDAILHAKMENRIRTLCTSGIDGLFVSIPSSSVLESIEYCQSLGIPVVSINAGSAFAESLGLAHHIGQIEYNAGVRAGQELVKGYITRAYCLSHEPENVAFIARCQGLEQATVRAFLATYGGVIEVPGDRAAQYRQFVEAAVEADLASIGQDSWEGVALLLLGQTQVSSVRLVKEDHPEVVIGSFDASDAVYAGLDDETLKFGTDQQSYLQGYYPIPLLTYMIETDQVLQTKMIESGPEIFVESPSDEKRLCESTAFEVCQPPVPAPSSSSTDYTAVIIAVSVIGAILIIAIIYLLYRLFKLSKHVEELEIRGQEVPKMSIRRRLSSVHMSLDKVVEEARRESVAAQDIKSAADIVAAEDNAKKG